MLKLLKNPKVKVSLCLVFVINNLFCQSKSGNSIILKNKSFTIIDVFQISMIDSLNWCAMYCYSKISINNSINLNNYLGTFNGANFKDIFPLIASELNETQIRCLDTTVGILDGNFRLPIDSNYLEPNQRIGSLVALSVYRVQSFKGDLIKFKINIKRLEQQIYMPYYKKNQIKKSKFLVQPIRYYKEVPNSLFISKHFKKAEFYTKKICGVN